MGRRPAREPPPRGIVHSSSPVAQEDAEWDAARLESHRRAACSKVTKEKWKREVEWRSAWAWA